MLRTYVAKYVQRKGCKMLNVLNSPLSASSAGAPDRDPFIEDVAHTTIPLADDKVWVKGCTWKELNSLMKDPNAWVTAYRERARREDVPCDAVMLGPADPSDVLLVFHYAPLAPDAAIDPEEPTPLVLVEGVCGTRILTVRVQKTLRTPFSPPFEAVVAKRVPDVPQTGAVPTEKHAVVEDITSGAAADGPVAITDTDPGSTIQTVVVARIDRVPDSDVLYGHYDLSQASPEARAAARMLAANPNAFVEQLNNPQAFSIELPEGMQEPLRFVLPADPSAFRFYYLWSSNDPVQSPCGKLMAHLSQNDSNTAVVEGMWFTAW